MTDDDQLHWLALRMVPGLGNQGACRLLQRFRGPRAIFRASRTELEGAGASGAVAQSIASGCSFEDAADQHKKVRDSGASLVAWSEPPYPALLRDIFDPPILLFARGRLELLEALMVAVVGTRRPTPYGMGVAERLSGDLARGGLGIASGMARGIDTAAHKGALAAGGDTVAVLGCGVDVVYPSENRKLAAEIAEKGLLLSEFPMGSTAFPQNFPIRNRVISGLSQGVLVVEGAQYSGSAITAKLALDQGREVFAVPGSITSRMSWGPNLLIKQGAKLVQDWNDIVEELSPEVRRRLTSRTGDPASPSQQELPVPVDEFSRWVLGQLRADAAVHVDQLVERLDQASPSQLIAALFELEIVGLVRQLPGRNFVRVW
ncbi:MAG: DNA-protecting protein DprA [Acidobacteria bacterium]|nr:DNA-protecting protein DprA [Acidobacteriota bacterium]